MNREEFIRDCDGLEKLVRTEFGYNQENMSEILGISKKTLVEIEKGRSSLGWSGSVVLCSLFSDSGVLESHFGGNPKDLIQALAFTHKDRIYPKTMGGHVWWRELEAANGYRIQQNIISGHYRILDSDDCRICFGFDLEEIRMYMPKKQ